MSILSFVRSIVVLVYYVQTSSSSVSSSNSSFPDIHKCTVWIAPSTIPGAGLGLFAGQSFDINDQVTTGDLIVPLLDMHWHNNVEAFDDTHQFIWDEYTWADHSFVRMEQEGYEVYGASFGIGALPNCLFGYVNVDESLNRYDTILDGDSHHHHRSSSTSPKYIDPGSGAFTPYHDRYSYATESIPAGHEIFVNYGYDYFLQDTRIQSIGIVPFVQSYELADQLVHEFVDFLDNASPQHDNEEQSSLFSSILMDLYNIVQNNISQTWHSRTLKALPPLNQNLKESDFRTQLYNWAHEGTGTIHRDRSMRSLEWLREHGRCASQLEIRPSTVKHAGRGAFATQSIPKGYVVAAVPLLHLPNRSILNMYDIQSFATPDDSEVVHQQLLLNYCFGHVNSTLLLCPYGVASSAINHHGSEPNVRIEWSRKLTLHPEWLTMSLDEWAYQYSAGLAFEYIATKDISKGDEIFLDYGVSWVEAWERHIAQWTPQTQPYDETEVELNQKWDSVLPTLIENDRDAQHVGLFCREEYRRMRGFQSSDTEEHRCRVRVRTNDHRYVAEVIARIEKRSTQTCFIRVKEVLFDLPRDAFVFRDAPYIRDHAQYWSFRHEIEVPDELFPNVWKNLE